MTAPASLLVVDDDADVLTAARLLLRKHFRDVQTAADPASIPERMAQASFDVYLLDMNFAIGRNSGAEGLHWLNYILDRDPDAVVILMTAFGDLNTAVRAMREGAADFVLKPWQNDKLVATLTVAAELRRTRKTVNALSTRPPSGDMIAESRVMKNILSTVARVAPTDATVLIRGENGTGKELIADQVHRLSTRAHKALVAVDLGAVAESLFESELFGHRRGAFTDADRDRPGRLQAADGGSLFLDEIGNLPLPLQSKLLRVLESREVTPLGNDRPVAVDVRIIAATNQPLEQMVEDGTFRQDLLYRINTIEIEIPPLRERPDDLQPLIEHFAARYSRKYRVSPKTINADACAALARHRWPGNVRELSHAVERAVILSSDDELGVTDFQLSASPGKNDDATLNLQANEKRLVATAIDQAGGNISRAANALGITRAALYRRIGKFGL